MEDFEVGGMQVKIFAKSFSIDGGLVYLEGGNLAEQVRCAIEYAHQKGKAAARAEIRRALGIRE